MKKLLLLACLCTLSYLSMAAGMIINNSACNITVTAFCYNYPGCTANTPCGAQLVTANNTAALPGCACPVGTYNAYRVCCGTSNVCVFVNDGTAQLCSSYPPSASLTCNADCSNLNVHWVAGDLLIDP